MMIYIAQRRFVLNRHCFNGLTRYNRAGEFNVGYGKYKTPYFPLQEMEAFLGAEGRSEFVCGDFAAVIEAAGEGDVIFAIRRMNRFQIQRDSRTIPVMTLSLKSKNARCLC